MKPGVPAAGATAVFCVAGRDRHDRDFLHRSPRAQAICMAGIFCRLWIAGDRAVYAQNRGRSPMDQFRIYHVPAVGSDEVLRDFAVFDAYRQLQ